MTVLLDPATGQIHSVCEVGGGGGQTFLFSLLEHSRVSADPHIVHLNNY